MSSSEHIARVRHERRLRKLLRRLPERMQAAIRWLRRRDSRWARIPAGVALVIGGCLSILPVFGLWMLPLGLALLADDIAPLRRVRGRALEWVAQRKPHWLHPANAPAAGETAKTGDSARPPGPRAD